MKILITLIFVLCLHQKSLGQLSGSTDHAKLVELKGHGGDIIGKMSIISGLHAEVVLKDCIQSEDSTGSHIIEYFFFKTNNLEARNVTLVLQFEQLFEDVVFATEGEVELIHTTIADNNAGLSFQARRLAPNAVIKIKVISNEPNIATITGIRGQLTLK